MKRLIEVLNEKFDQVHVLTTSDKRKNGNLMAELRRVGVEYHKSFIVHEDVECPMQFDVLRWVHLWENVWDTDYPPNCAWAHYCAVKFAFQSGAQRILVMEDDVRFMKDLLCVCRIFENTPDADAVYYDCEFSSSSPLSEYEPNRGCFYVGPMYDIVFADCYALTRRGMEAFINSVEYLYSNPVLSEIENRTVNFRNPDHWYSLGKNKGWKDFFDYCMRESGIFTSAISLVPPCMQLSQPRNNPSSNMNIDISKYNVYSDDSDIFGYDIYEKFSNPVQQICEMREKWEQLILDDSDLACRILRKSFDRIFVILKIASDFVTYKMSEKRLKLDRLDNISLIAPQDTNMDNEYFSMLHADASDESKFAWRLYRAVKSALNAGLNKVMVATSGYLQKISASELCRDMNQAADCENIMFSLGQDYCFAFSLEYMRELTARFEKAWENGQWPTVDQILKNG